MTNSTHSVAPRRATGKRDSLAELYRRLVDAGMQPSEATHAVDAAMVQMYRARGYHVSEADL